MPLTINPPSRPSPIRTTSIPSQTPPNHQERENSPDAPPASPLTPPLPPVRPATTQEQQPHQTAHFIQQPPSLPFSADDSSDAIALRAAISSLQFQRQQAQRDLRSLEEIKHLAVQSPERYRQHVLSLAQRKSSKPSWKEFQSQENDGDVAPGAMDVDAEDMSTMTDDKDSQHVSSDPGKETRASEQPPTFPTVPLPQDVVRCPPIEWAKYNIVGEALDKIHQDQQLRPGDSGTVERDSVVAAPYNPFLDKLDHMQLPEAAASATGRKDSGASAVEQSSSHRRRSSNKAGA